MELLWIYREEQSLVLLLYVQFSLLLVLLRRIASFGRGDSGLAGFWRPSFEVQGPYLRHANCSSSFLWFPSPGLQESNCFKKGPPSVVHTNVGNHWGMNCNLPINVLVWRADSPMQLDISVALYLDELSHPWGLEEKSIYFFFLVAQWYSILWCSVFLLTNIFWNRICLVPRMTEELDYISWIISLCSKDIKS